MVHLTLSDTFSFEQYAYFIRIRRDQRLNGKPLLDSTMTLMGGGMAYGHSHGNTTCPRLAGAWDWGKTEPMSILIRVF